MNRTTIIIAVLTFIAVIILNNEIQKHEIALKVQKMDLDQMKVNVANAAQKTFEMSKDLAKFRLLQGKILASWDEKFGEQMIQNKDKPAQSVKKQKTQIVIKLEERKKREQAAKEQRIQIVKKREQAAKEQRIQIVKKREQAAKEQKIQIAKKREQAAKEQKIQIAKKREQAVKEKRIQIENKREQAVKKQKIQLANIREQAVKEQKIPIGNKSEQAVKERPAFNYAKISKELHPSLDLSCNHEIVKPTETKKNTVIIGCMIKNNGVYKVYIVPLRITMLEHMEQRMIDNAIESTDYLYPTISAPGNNSNRKQYKVTLTEHGVARLKKGYSFQISFKASTVESGLNKIKSQVKGAIKDSKLKEMSEFNYDYVMAI